MLPSQLLVDLSRAQFAFTALFHFLFVPLTLGLTWLLVIMEGLYLKTGNVVYKDMTKFWAKLLAINFAMGIVTGITLEFEFGQNWAYFSRMIGGSFGPILAIEGITAFMLEATMFGLFFFSWDKLSKGAHWCVTFLMAVGASLSIVNILAANSWMQHPIATTFNYQNMSLELHSITALYLNALAQIRIGHVAFAGFLTSAMFVMGISAYYLLKNKYLDFAKKSFSVAAGFGLVCVLSVGFFGDQNGLQVAQYEPEKMAAIEAQWETQPAPAAWDLIAFPNQAEEKNNFSIKIPYLLSLITTHSLKGTVEGLKPLMQTYEKRTRDGIKAYSALEKLRAGDQSPAVETMYHRYLPDLGYALLLQQFNPRVVNATAAEIKANSRAAIPQVFTAFWAFRIMLGAWGLMLIAIIMGVIYVWRNKLQHKKWYLKTMLYFIPLPYIAAEAGWVLAEVGRQPWTVHQILPTYLSVSSISNGTIIGSLSGFILFYVSLLAVELFLMFKYARKGPSILGTDRY